MKYFVKIEGLLSLTAFQSDDNIQPLKTDIMTWEAEPDTTEIVLNPNLEIFKPYNSDVVSYLTTKINNYSVLKWNDIYIEVEDADIFTAGDTVWIEEEPLYILEKITSYKYSVSRPFRRTHIFLSGLVTKTYPLTVLGCIGEIYNHKNELIKYFTVDSLMSSGAGAVLTVSDILKYFDNEFPMLPKGFDNSYYFNSEIFYHSGLFNFVETPTRDIRKIAENWDLSPLFKSVNPFIALTQLTQLEGFILSFYDGQYRFYKGQSLNVFESSEELYLDDYIDFNGGYEFYQVVGGTKIKTEIDFYEVDPENGLTSTQTVKIALTFGGNSNGRDVIEPDLSGVFTGFNDIEKVIEYFRLKLASGVGALKALIYGTLKIYSSPFKSFKVGQVYDFKDKRKFKLFLSNQTPMKLYCVESSQGENTFLVVRADSTWSPIGPVLPMYWDGSKFNLVNMPNKYQAGTFSDYLLTENNAFEEAFIPNTTQLYFAANDYIKVRKNNSSAWVEKRINTVLGTELTVTDSTGLTTDFYYIRFTDSANRGSKYSKFLDIDGGTYV